MYLQGPFVGWELEVGPAYGHYYSLASIRSLTVLDPNACINRKKTHTKHDWLVPNNKYINCTSWGCTIQILTYATTNNTEIVCWLYSLKFEDFAWIEVTLWDCCVVPNNAWPLLGVFGIMPNPQSVHNVHVHGVLLWKIIECLLHSIIWPLEIICNQFQSYETILGT